MKDALKNVLFHSELAAKTGKSRQRIGQIRDDLVAAGLAKQKGILTIYHVDAVEWILNRPDGRGKYER